MGKLKRFDILFENSDAVFFAGHLVSGTVCVELTEPMKMRELRLLCLGRAYIHWCEVENVGHRGGRQRIETVDYSDSEDYFEFELLLWKPKGSNSGDDDSMASGEHWFPFSFTLPPNLPPSFEGDYGYIRYWVKATVDRPWKFDHHAKRAFSVIACLDLNREPTAPHVTYVSGRKYRQEKKVIRCLQLDEIQRGKTTTWRETLQIPALPPTHLRGCKLITTQYFLHFVVSSDARCSCDDIEFEDEIIIGTIPLVPAPPPSPAKLTQPLKSGAVEEKRRGKKGGRSEEDEGILDVLDGRKPSEQLAVSDPPSYEECMFGQVSIKDKDDSENTAGILIFVPRYSFYRHSNRTQSSKGS